ncbi:hypothetical protein BC829DRAFT_400184, partial [Chytridium lagenaria]
TCRKSDGAKNGEKELEGTLNRIREIQRRMAGGGSVSDEEAELCKTAGEVMMKLRALQEGGGGAAAPMLMFPTVAGKKSERRRRTPRHQLRARENRQLPYKVGATRYYEPCPADDVTWSAGIYVARDLSGKEGIYFDFSAWPIPLSQADRPKTSFQPPFPSSSPLGKRYRFKVVPIDMPGTNAAIQNVLEEGVFEGLVASTHPMGAREPGPDDLVTRGDSFENHFRLLSEVVHRIRISGMPLALDECRFGLKASGEPADLPPAQRRAFEAIVNSIKSGK